MIKILNATPHEVVLDNGKEKVIFPPSGKIARVCMHTDVIGKINGFDVVKNIPGEVEGIPSQEEGICWIVSAMVLSNSSRNDLIAPDTNRATRNEKGHIISVPGFVK